jgi:hypothetical protein
MINGTQGDPTFLSGRTAGVGMMQTIAILRRRSQNQEINVVVNDYFIHLALLMYLEQDRNLHITSLNMEYRKGYTERLKAAALKAASEMPTYLIVNASSSPPASWPLTVVASFNKNSGKKKSTMYLTRVINVSHHR